MSRPANPYLTGRTSSCINCNRPISEEKFGSELHWAHDWSGEGLCHPDDFAEPWDFFDEEDDWDEAWLNE